MAAIAKADWQIHDWRGELIDRRLDYYHEGHEEHEGSIDKLRALRDLRGFKILADKTSDRQNLVAASMAYRLYSKLCCRFKKTSGTKRCNPAAMAAALLWSTNPSRRADRNRSVSALVTEAHLQFNLRMLLVAITILAMSLGFRSSMTALLPAWRDLEGRIAAAHANIAKYGQLHGKGYSFEGWHNPTSLDWWVGVMLLVALYALRNALVKSKWWSSFVFWPMQQHCS